MGDWSPDLRAFLSTDSPTNQVSKDQTAKQQRVSKQSEPTYREMELINCEIFWGKRIFLAYKQHQKSQRESVDRVNYVTIKIIRYQGKSEKQT